MAVTLARGSGVRLQGGTGVRRQSLGTNGSRLWEMGDPSGLPRNGLVAYYDPYRSAYGRNVSATTTGAFTVDKMAHSAGTFFESADVSYHVARCAWLKFPFPFCVAYTVTPVGRKRFMLGEGVTTSWALFDTETVAVVSKGAGCPSASIADNGDGTYTLTATLSNCYGHIYSMPDAATDNTSRSFAGDTSKGFTMNQWQLNLGPVLHPYSAPAGEPGTLQTLTDYSGNGNHLTLGATTGASTDDPAFTGLGLLFAGDYVKSGNLAGVTMAGDWSLPIVCKPSGTSGAIVSLADATAADQYQAIEFNGSTKVRIHTKNGATDTASSDLTVSNSTVQMLSLVSSGNTMTLKRMDTGTSVTATNADPTGTPRLVIGGLGVSTIGTLADGLDVNLLPLYGRALSVSEETRIYRHVKSLFAGRGVTVA